MFNVMLYRFDHHDCVINNDANRENQSKHCKHIDTETQYREQDEGAEQRDWHGAHRNDCRPEALQEDIYDDQHQDDCFNERVDDFIHRSLDWQRRIESDVVIHVRWKSAFRILKNFFHVFRGSDGVCTGREIDANCTRRRAIKTSAQVVGLRPEFNTANVLDFHLRTIRVGTNDDVGEFVRVFEQAKRPDIESALLAGWRWLGANATRRRLGILFADCFLDICGSNAQ